MKELLVYLLLPIICIIVYYVYSSTAKHIAVLRIQLQKSRDKQSEQKFTIDKLQYELNTANNANRLLQAANIRQSNKIDELGKRINHLNDVNK